MQIGANLKYDADTMMSGNNLIIGPVHPCVSYGYILVPTFILLQSCNIYTIDFIYDVPIIVLNIIDGELVKTPI